MSRKSKAVCIILDALAAGIALIPIAWFFAGAPSFPPEVPLHFGVGGADRWGDPMELAPVAFLPLCLTAFCIVSQILNLANLPLVVTREKRTVIVAVITLASSIAGVALSMWLFGLSFGG